MRYLLWRARVGFLETVHPTRIDRAAAQTVGDVIAKSHEAIGDIRPVLAFTQDLFLRVKAMLKHISAPVQVEQVKPYALADPEEFPLPKLTNEVKKSMISRLLRISEIAPKNSVMEWLSRSSGSTKHSRPSSSAVSSG